jgi:hypothetical protein
LRIDNQTGHYRELARSTTDKGALAAIDRLIAKLEVEKLALHPPPRAPSSLDDLRTLPDRQPNARPMVDGRGKDLPRLVQAAAGIEHVVDLDTVLGPLLDFVEIAVVRNQWFVGFFVVVHIQPLVPANRAIFARYLILRPLEGAGSIIVR